MLDFLSQKQAGLTLFPSGKENKIAFEQAVKFLHAAEATSEKLQIDSAIVLGERISAYAQSWLEREILAEGSAYSGKRIFTWKEWISHCARRQAIEENRVFRESSDLEEREFLRQILTGLEEREILGAYRGLWQEEKFFADLLRLVREFRRKGFSTPVAIENLRESLAAKGEEGKALVKHDLWSILTTWQLTRDLESEPVLDQASQINSLLESSYQGPDSLFLLGLEDLGAAEIDWLNHVAESAEIFWPVPLKEGELRKIFAESAGETNHASYDSVATHSLRLLQSTFPQSRVRLLTIEGVEAENPILDSEQNSIREFPFFLAHTEVEEARAASAFIAELLKRDAKLYVQVVAPKAQFQNTILREAWTEFLPDIANGHFPARAVLDQGYISLFLNTINLLVKDSELSPGIDLLLALFPKERKDAEVFIRELWQHGCTGGIENWRRIADKGDSEVAGRFISLLTELQEIFPKQGNCAQFADAMEKSLLHAKFFELVRNSENSSQERDAHAAISLLQKASARLAVDYTGEYSLEGWLQELWLLLSTSPLEGVVLQDRRVGIYHPGEWMPPVAESRKLVRIVVNLSSAYDPSPAHPYFTKDTDRQLLSDWGIKTNTQSEGSLYNWFCDSILPTDRLAISSARFSASGSEISDSFLHHCANYRMEKWPDISQGVSDGQYEHPSLTIEDTKTSFNHYSASALDRYFKCPYLFYAEKVLNGEDTQAELALDWSRLEEGSLAHKVLEFFFRDRSKWHGKEGEEQKAYFSECFEKACRAMDYTYYLGGPSLDHFAEERLSRKLWDFVQSELEYFKEFPNLTESKTESKFELPLPKSGKILKGSIDRVDFDKQANRFLVWDYKSGATPSNKEIRQNENLQLPIYIWAGTESGFGEPAGGAFISMKKKKRSEGVFVKEFCRTKKNLDETYYVNSSRTKLELAEFPKFLSDTIEETEKRISQIESGDFSVRPVNADDCSRCEKRPACRIREGKLQVSEKLPSLDFSEVLAFTNEAQMVAPEAESKQEIVFSADQELALSTRNKLVFLEASAGSGKTTILVEKYRREIQHLILNQGLSPEKAVDSVLAVSFTEKSASEIKARLMQLLLNDFGPGIALRGIKNVSTIHGLNQRIIREYAHLLNVDPMFDVLDEIRSKDLLDRALFLFFTEVLDAADDLLKDAFSTAFQYYSRGDIADCMKLLTEKRGFWNSDEALHDFLENGVPNAERIFVEEDRRTLLGAINILFQRFLALYTAEKREQGVLDFNDLELVALGAKESPEIVRDMQQRFSLILVDEFQDTNSLQRNLIESIAQPKLRNVFVVGDAKQSIYRFRSADVSVFQKLKAEAQNFGLVCSLDKNYRSQGAIVQFANEVSKKIFPRAEDRVNDFEAELAVAEFHREPEAIPELWRFSLEDKDKSAETIRRKEAEAVVAAIKKMVVSGESLQNIAVLFSKLTSIQIYTAALRAANIPYVLESKRGFYTQSVVLDGTILLRSIYLENNRLARLALLRSPWYRTGSELVRNALDSDSHLYQKRWFKELSESRVELRPSKALAKAYRQHPLFSEAIQRVQMDKLVHQVQELETGLKSWGEIVEQVSTLTGWTAEENAATSSVVPDPDAGHAVKLMTVHASKGLEFSSVLLPDIDGSLRVESDIIRYDQSIGCSLKWREPNGDFAKGESYDLLAEPIREREEAESARLFYVAMTRAKNKLVIFQHSEAPSRGGKSFSWGNVLRNHDWGDSLRIIDFKSQQDISADPKLSGAAVENPANHSIQFVDSLENKDLINLSVTELSSYVYCPEFHRLKFVQRWEDLVVENWEVETVRRPFTEQSAASPLLKSMKLSNKERGITVHRVLENLDGATENPDLWRKILNESYTAQGAPEDSPALQQLIALDVELVQNFLQSPVGTELFTSITEFFSEMPISLAAGGVRLSGAVDRVVQKEDGRWLVVDYKTASMDGAIERYTVQVQVYMSALRNILRSRNISNPKIEGWIIDLFSGDGKPVAEFEAGAIDELALSLKGAYQNREQHFQSGIPDCAGSKACLVCPYTSVCAMGREFIEKQSQ